MTPRLLRSFRAAGSAFVLAVALAFGLAGCTPADDVAAELRGSVVEIAEHAAAGDFTGALAELDLLTRDVDAAVAEGAIDDARGREIRAAIDLVRADLEAAVAAANSPAPAPSPGEGESDDGEGGNDGGNGNGGNGGTGGNGGNGGNGGGDSGTGGDGGSDGGSGDQSTAPATEPPATDPPATEPPATEPPATEGPDTGDEG